MKQIILFIIIFAVGAVSYPFLNSLLSSLTEKESPTQKIATTTPVVVPSNVSAEKTVPTQSPADTSNVVIDEQGALHDGPFKILDARGTETGATAEIIRSPEETLLQFKKASFTHSADSNIYFSTDTKATKYMSLGQAKLNSGVYVYGMPIDADLSSYRYILIFNPDTNVTEFTAAL